MKKIIVPSYLNLNTEEETPITNFIWKFPFVPKQDLQEVVDYVQKETVKSLGSNSKLTTNEYEQD